MKFKKVLCLVLCLSFFLGAVNSSGILASAQSESELKENVDEIKNQIADSEAKKEEIDAEAAEQEANLEKLESQIAEIESKAADLQIEINDINGEITTLTAEYNRLKAEIDAKNKSIIETSAMITSTEKEIEDSKDLLSAKLRSAYMNGSDSTLKILMGADSLASFLTRLEMMKRTSENDKRTIEDFKTKVTSLKNARVQLEKDKAIIVADQKKVEETRTQYAKQKNVLEVRQNEYSAMVVTIEAQYAEIESYVASLDKQSAEYQSYITELQQQKAAADAELDEFINNYLENNPPVDSDNNYDADYDVDYSDMINNSGSSYYESNDDWVWPVGDSSYYISAYYKDPSYYAEIGSVHYGIDISGSGFYGTCIYAARAGTVISSGDAGDGYGYKVIIDHGDGFLTVYAHNSVNVVSTGQYVEKGQLISYAGSSGYSTGPHLHYEVRYNGEKIDPAYYHPGKV